MCEDRQAAVGIHPDGSPDDEHLHDDVDRLLKLVEALKHFEPPESDSLRFRPGLFLRPQRTLLGATAALLSRLYLPPWQVALSWPARTGQIRAAGRLFYAFYAAACLLWMTASFAVCLLVCIFVHLVARIIELNPSALTPRRPVPADSVLPTLLGFVHNTSPCAHVVLWTVVGLLLYGALVWVFRRGPASLPAQVAFPAFVILATGVQASGFLAAFSLYAASFPGLFLHGAPPSILPWWSWLHLAWALLIYRGSTPYNPRLLEFTTEFGTRTFWDRFGQDRPLHRSSPAAPVCGRSGCPGMTPEGQQHLQGLGFLSREDLEAIRFEHRERYIKFCEREGLDTLLDPDSPERRYYTPEQRGLFAKACADMRLSLAYRKRQLRLIAEQRRDGSRATEEQALPEPTGL